MNRYEKIITINELNKEVITRCVNLIINCMFEKSPHPEYFQLRLKDSEKSPFSKDLKLEWCELKDKHD